MQAEQLQNLFRIPDQCFQLIVTGFRFDDFDQLHLVELMHANHAARADSSGSGFGAKAWTVSAVINGQLALLQNLFPMDIGHRRFGRGQQIQFAQALPVQPLLHGVSLVFKLGELPHPHHAVPPHNIRRRNFGVTVFVGVQVQEELDQRSFQLCAPTGVEQKTAAREFGAAREIDQPQLFANLDVRPGLESKRRLFSPGANLGIVRGALPHRHARVRKIGQANQDFVPSRLHLDYLLVQVFDPRAQVLRLLLFRFCFVQFLLPHQRANFLGNPVAQGFELFGFCQQFPPLLIEAKKLVDLGLIPSPPRRQPFPHQVRFFANQFDVQHRRIIGRRLRRASIPWRPVGNPKEARNPNSEGHALRRCSFRISACG